MSAGIYGKMFNVSGQWAIKKLTKMWGQRRGRMERTVKIVYGSAEMRLSN